jgi:hypothetical protein
MIMNSDQSKPYKSSKYFGFVSSRSFQRYQWCYYRSFGVSSKFFFYFFFLSPLCNLWRGKRDKKKKKDLEGTLKLRWWYHWYCWKDLNDMNTMTSRNVRNSFVIEVSLYLRVFFSLFFSLSPHISTLFIINYVSLFLILKRVAYDTYDSRVANVICNSLNYTIF